MSIKAVFEYCPDCGNLARSPRRIPPDILECQYCGAHFTESQERLADGDKSKRQDRPRLYAPNSITVHEDGNALIITRKWSWLIGAAMYAFSGVMAYIWYTSWDVYPSNSSQWDLFMLVLGGVVLTLAVTGTYNIMNSTRYHITRDSIVITHKPLPWFDSWHSLASVDQLFVKQHITRTSKGTRIDYSLNRLDTNGGQKEIARSLSQEEAQFLEYEIERWLGIDNYAVHRGYDEYIMPDQSSSYKQKGK